MPTPAAAAAYDAIVISGSHYSAYEEHKWIHKLLQLLPQYATQGTRLYGCCFGAQVCGSGRVAIAIQWDCSNNESLDLDASYVYESSHLWVRACRPVPGQPGVSLTPHIAQDHLNAHLIQCIVMFTLLSNAHLHSNTAAPTAALSKHPRSSVQPNLAECTSAQQTPQLSLLTAAQILARALGGSVGHNPDGNFVLTIEQIQPTAELQEVTELHAVVQQALQDSCKIADRSNSSSCRSRPAQLAAGAAKDKGSGSAAPAAAVDGSAAPPAAVDGPAVCAAAAVGSAAHAAAEGAVVDGLQELHLSCNNGCFRLIESHGDQVGSRKGCAHCRVLCQQ